MPASVDIKPQPAADTNKKYMMVDYDVVHLKAGDEITFTNSLNQPVSDVHIKFYKYDHAKNDANAIGDFCTIMDTANKQFKVPKGSNAGGSFTPGTAKCIVTNNVKIDAYKYSVDAQASAWIDMDPVIIVEGGGGIVPILPIIVAVVAGVVGTLATQKIVANFRKDRKDSGQQPAG